MSHLQVNMEDASPMARLDATRLGLMKLLPRAAEPRVHKLMNFVGDCQCRLLIAARADELSAKKCYK